MKEQEKLQYCSKNAVLERFLRLPMETSASAKQIVLIVEDDSFLREIIAKKIQSAGFDVHEAASGENAFELLQKVRPGLILLDLILPKMNGFELVEKMRREDFLKDIPVIFLSNYAETQGMKRSADLGVRDYLVKAKLTPGEVLERVEKFFKEG